MSLRLRRPTREYESSEELRRNQELEQADSQNHKRGADIDHPHHARFRDGVIIGDADRDTSQMTRGLVIDQGTALDTLFSGYADSIAHGLTGFGNTNSFINVFRKGAAGGFGMHAIARDDATPNVMQFKAYGGTAPTTKAVSARALVEHVISEHDGANTVTNVTANGNVYAIRCRRDGSDETVFLVDEDGDIWHLGGIASPFQTFTANDATPSVSGGKNFKTANTSATTITDFDDGIDGQEIVVVINDANTTIDFTSSGLRGNGGVDWSPASGDHMRCTHDGTDWFCAVAEG